MAPGLKFRIRIRAMGDTSATEIAKKNEKNSNVIQIGNMSKKNYSTAIFLLNQQDDTELGVF